MSASLNPTIHLAEMRKLSKTLAADLRAQAEKKKPEPGGLRERLASLLASFHKLDTGTGAPRQWLENAGDENAVLAASEESTQLLVRARLLSKGIGEELDRANKRDQAAPNSLRGRASRWIEMFEDLDQVISEGGDSPSQWSGE